MTNEDFEIVKKHVYETRLFLDNCDILESLYGCLSQELEEKKNA